MSTLSEFLETVVTTKEGYFCLGHAAIGGGDWINEWFKYPTQIDSIVSKVDELKTTRNIYFSAHLFNDKSKIKENVLPTRTIQADLDEADLTLVPIKATYIIETSPNRHQCYIVLKDDINLEALEILSRKFTYSVPKCDPSGWPLGHMVRIPTSLNYKYLEGPYEITIHRHDPTEYFTKDLELLPDKVNITIAKKDDDWINSEHKDSKIHYLELLESIKTKLPPSVYANYNIETSDRSATLWALMCSLFRSTSLNRDQVYYLAYNSKNNKFSSLRYGGEKELARDVLRAEALIKTPIPDAKILINEIRKDTNASMAERRQLMSKVVMKALQLEGEFYHGDDESLWFVRRDNGRPIYLAGRSDYLDSLLNLQFGLNNAETDKHYVINNLIAYVVNMSPNCTCASLSRFDKLSNHILLHTGQKDVISITAKGITNLTNGAYGTIFPWNSITSAFSMDFSALPNNLRWYNLLFDMSLDNIAELTRESAEVILRVWFLFMIMRDAAVSRPILALFGQPGCISSHTKLSIRRGEHSAREFTIGHAYRSFRGRWDRNIPTRIMSLKDGVIKSRNIKNIIKSGRKLTYTIVFKTHGSIRTTVDHRFLTPYGYKTLSELHVGDEVIVKGDFIYFPKEETYTRKITKAKYHPHGRSKLVNGYGPYKSILYARAVLDANMNNLSVEEFIYIINNDKAKSSELSYNPDDITIHHKDENPENDKFSNLEIMTKLEHDELHGNNNVKNLGEWSGLYGTDVTTVKSIEPYKEEETYDIEMEDQEAPNFLVNDVVIHNSGKSTLCRRIYALIYGRGKSIGSITTPDDFDHSLATDPFYAIDNVDTWERWFPDRLALCASTTDIIKRKLYTDKDVVTLKRQALVAVTAHNPKFGREDVADRLLLLTFNRLTHFVPEGEIIDNILLYRNQMWGDICKDLQKILQTPNEYNGSVPQFRVEDFARLGYWIASSLGVAKEFKTALEAISKKQRSFSVEDEGILVSSLLKFCKDSRNEKWYTANELFTSLEAKSDNSSLFVRIYGNPTRLSKKLWTMKEALKDIVLVDRKFESMRGYSFNLKLKGNLND